MLAVVVVVLDTLELPEATELMVAVLVVFGVAAVEAMQL
tara:strand:+ start:388 stop:504 length:117 start_codon:yes stop_codon:yes gene_type:complete